MEVYDLLMVLVLGGATIFGAMKGLAWQVASVASIFMSYVVAYEFRNKLAGMIDAQPPWNMFTAMLVLYIGTSFVIWFGFRMVSNFIESMRLREFDRQVGALLGFGKGALLCIVITFFAVTLLGEAQRQNIVRSHSGRYIAKLLHDADPVMPREVKEVLGPYVDTLERRLDPGEQGATDDLRSFFPEDQIGGFEDRVRDSFRNTIQDEFGRTSDRFSNQFDARSPNQNRDQNYNPPPNERRY